ncbi:copper chaperone PCu(A)C [Kocuria sp.]|uniref:copper chaperone PCu(A)C n=1 Tax=Kocuria sp. TaxID=1871328 RepID=UPI0026DAA142|nr:copper chaperone PCu(A)C [Kocuria sp.]MDO4918199.1 copper chaperone PCu(A)C [Kocuria sp.]
MNTMNTTASTIPAHRSAAPRAAGSARPARRALAAAAALGLGLAALTGCSTQSGDQAASSAGESSATATATGPLELKDGWAKAADSDMTAVFGTLTNTSDKDVTLTGAAAEGTAETVQLHETAKDSGTGAMQMKEKDGGFTIAAGQSVTLEPGGNHIMLMGLTCSLQPGSDLGLQLRTDAGTQDVTVPVRDYSGAKESYAPGEDASSSAGDHDEHASHEGMDMSSPGADEQTGASPSSSALPECHGH